MVVSMETRKFPEKLRQEFSEIDEFGTQISMFLENYLGQLFRVKKCEQSSSLTMHKLTMNNE